ncbi:MAG TPA: hypothetical protein VFE91_06980 [Nitrososphaerales archaeon]|nr:hypothetical protein [Nitrososphaerales archaeon]
MEKSTRGTNPSNDEIRLLWDEILDILLERIHHKSISNAELSHLGEELNVLFRAVKGRRGAWDSVIDVALILLKRDTSVSAFRAELPYDESTIYRALARLESSGFATTTSSDDGLRRWTVDRNRCPVLHRATRLV